GDVDGVAGLVVVYFTESYLWSPQDPPTSSEVLDVVLERLAPLGVPLVTGAPVGHGSRNLAGPPRVPGVRGPAGHRRPGRPRLPHPGRPPRRPGRARHRPGRAEPSRGTARLNRVLS